MTTDLDRLIEAVVSGPQESPPWRAAFGWNETLLCENAYRGSLDAAVMLHEALLPSAVWGRSLDGVMWVSLSAKTVSIYGFYRGNSDSPARSLLLATLRAYRSTMEAP